MTQPNSCPHHAGEGKAESREQLRPVMERLPNNQSGEKQMGRHKCPYCAYEEGYKKGYKDSPNSCPRHAGVNNVGIREQLRPVMERLPNNQSGEKQMGRHKCPYCAYEEGYKKGGEDRAASISPAYPPR